MHTSISDGSLLTAAYPEKFPWDEFGEDDGFTPASKEDDELLTAQVLAYYTDELRQNPRAQRYLRETRGLRDPDLIDALNLGFSGRTLGFKLPNGETVEGAAIRGRLQRLGILRPSGHELFRGSLVFPVFDDQGNLVDAYGRKITHKLRTGTAYHVTLAPEPVGIFNGEALTRSRDIVLCKSPLEAATLWCAKFRNVISTMGMRGFTDEMLEAFAKNGTERVYIAFDNTAVGRRAACQIAQAVSLLGIEARRVLFPSDMDANAFNLSVSDPVRAFAERIREARPCRQSYEQIMEDGQCK